MSFLTMILLEQLATSDQTKLESRLRLMTTEPLFGESC